MDLLLALTRGIRNARATLGVAARERLAATLLTGEAVADLTENLDWLARLAGLDASQLNIQPGESGASQAETPATAVTAGPFVCLLHPSDHDVKSDRSEVELRELTRRIARSEALLSGPFGQRAPIEVVQRERDKLAELRERSLALQAQLERR
jgi:valyl-tRNA synthetase